MLERTFRMGEINGKKRFEIVRLILLPALLAGILGFLLSANRSVQPVLAFSSGPPAGYTGAPREEPEACAECHVPPDAGTGHISITAPQTYVPGQTYQITVTHSNADLTRVRWGFELTALDTSDEKAGELQNTDALTQILNNAGPGNARQYIEHTAAGTFIGQQNGASWTFNWTAPPTDIGVVTFYAAGNQANNDGNTSGDYIYKTLVTAAPFASTPDFSIIASPSLRAVTPGTSAQYTLTITPSAGFTGSVNLSATGLPGGATANFNPTSVSITDATSRSATLTISTTAGTPLGDFPINVTGTAGSIVHSSPVTLKVVSASSMDLAVTKTVSPNPGQVNVALTYRVTVTNNGPATATNVSLTDTLPSGVAFGSASTTQGSCGVNGPPLVCSLNNLAVGASAIVTIVVTPSAPGQITNTATAGASETDFDTSNNSASITTFIQAAAASPLMLDNNLTVSTVLTGLDQPTSLAFIGPNDFFVLERATGKVLRVLNGVLQGAVLDLKVNSFSERGLLGIALHPQFAQNGYVYLFWTESSTGVNTSSVDDITLLANRVDRYSWNGTALTFDRNLIKLRAQQEDGTQAHRGNHNGGVLRFGTDGKLYILFGDNGRRGFLQNLAIGGPVPDDQYGGPDPDDAHLTGVILRLNDDGSTPTDNPFFSVNSGLSGQAAANVKKVFAYGVRNGFGMALDPLSGNIWTEENGDDAFDEINRLKPGFNGGWVQIIGPVNRVADFKSIESTYGAGNLQQLRWPPSNIADTPQAALARLYMLPGAQYTDPEFSWKYAVAPSPLGFIRGRGLGPQFEGDMFVGASRTTLSNGFLFRFKMSADRQHFAFTDSKLADLVADNTDKFDLTESESLLIGRDFGITTDIQTGPNGNLFVVSLSNGAVYEIKSKPSTFFFATLTGGQQVPPTNSTATGTAVLQLSPDETTAQVSLNFAGLSSPQTDAHIHGPAAVGSNAGVLFPLPLGQVNDFSINLSAQQIMDLKSGLLYVNVHSNTFPSGEIRGQFQTSAGASAIMLGASKASVNESESTATITVTRSNSAAAATVDYSTNDFMAARCDTVPASASAKCDYTTSGGTLRFAAGEASKTITVSIIDDAFVEGNETLTINLSNPTGAGIALGSPLSATITIVDNDANANVPNPYLDNAFFVRQQYLDFLLREPDTAGYNDWLSVLNNCGPQQGGLGAPVGCDRVHVSSGFFRSTEFGEKGYWVYRFFEGSLGRRPTFAEFMPEVRRLSGLMTDAEQESRRADFIGRFMQLPEFTSIYTGITDAAHASQFIAKLEEKARVILPATAQTEPGQPTQYDRTQLINLMQTGSLTPAQTLRAFIEQKVVWDSYFYRAFVAMQYFGYLRRDPEAAGYDDWVDVLTNGRASAGIAPGDYRHLIFGFVYSVEYRERFGKP